MSNISILRTLVKNGWTIANRKNVVSEIGKDNFRDITICAQKANMFDTFEYTNVIGALKLDTVNESKEILENISHAYKNYAESPYINDFLRKGFPLSDKSKKIIDALKQAISNSKVSGIFVRGLTPTKTNSLDTLDDIAKFIFGNKGFTSVVPEINADFANCFANGKKGIKVIFDIKSMPGYRASNYEVLFDTEAFNPEQFNIAKINEHLYKVTQK